jgi:hypothetical protein
MGSGPIDLLLGLKPAKKQIDDIHRRYHRGPAQTTCSIFLTAH